MTMDQEIHHQHKENIVVAGRDYRCLFRREVDSGYRVTCTALPPMLAFGETLDEARANAREEIEAWIDEEDRTCDLALIERRHWCWSKPA
jgi:predicted RNase H-like HicB family nuclease